MGDGYWNRQPTLHSSAEMLKRPRSDYEKPIADLQPSRVPSVYEHNYLAREDGRDGAPIVKDTRTIGSAYDRYLQNAQLSSFTSGEASAFSGVGLGMPSLPLKDTVPMGRSGAVDSRLPVDIPNGRGMGFDSRLPMDAPSGRGLGFDDRLPVDIMPRPARETLPLPPDASSTLYVEGLPRDCTRREVAHIFRPFVGYKEARLVSKDSRQRGGDPLILCFVDFVSPACAATALSALQGYKMDEHDPDSANLRLQFSKHPGPRSGSGYRGRR